jgi:hypothetical protein
MGKTACFCAAGISERVINAERAALDINDLLKEFYGTEDTKGQFAD